MKLFKLFLATILILSFFPCCAIPRQPWTVVDKAMFVTVCAAQAYDFKTTDDYIGADNNLRSEWQWLYGTDSPSSGVLAISKAAQLGLAWAVLDRVKSGYRKVLMCIMTGTWVWYGRRN